MKVEVTWWESRIYRCSGIVEVEKGDNAFDKVELKPNEDIENFSEEHRETDDSGEIDSQEVK